MSSCTVPLWGDSYHFLIAQDALRGGHGRQSTAKCHCSSHSFASVYKLVCCPSFFCTGFQLNKRDTKNIFGFIEKHFINRAEHSLSNRYVPIQCQLVKSVYA